jgi:LysM repeat protein
MRPKTPVSVIIIFALIALVLALGAPCQAMVYHTVRKGENLAIVAKHYYGDPDKALFLIEYNGIRDPRSINPGRRIAVPEARIHRVRKGDTLSRIAKKYLNDSRKSLGLARLNGIKDPTSISPGMTITIPVEILHTVKKGDTLSRIAQRYYGHADASGFLALYNDIKDPRNLKPGTRLILPIWDLRIIKKKSRPRRPPRPRPKTQRVETKGEILLEKGIIDYFVGDYRGAVKNLQKALAVGLTEKGDVSKTHRFLAFAYVALNEPDRAKRCFREALKIDPDLRLDPVYVSPKIIAVFEEVR